MRGKRKGPQGRETTAARMRAEAKMDGMDGMDDMD